MIMKILFNDELIQIIKFDPINNKEILVEILKICV